MSVRRTTYVVPLARVSFYGHEPDAPPIRLHDPEPSDRHDAAEQAGRQWVQHHATFVQLDALEGDPAGFATAFFAGVVNAMADLDVPVVPQGEPVPA